MRWYRRGFVASVCLAVAIAYFLRADQPKAESSKPEPTKAEIANAEAAKSEKKPKVEVLFCLDTTGSMGGLLEGAKQKIWSISNQIAGGKPTPDIKIGLVAYRDKKDKYITQIYELTDDLDAIHAHLKTFKAEGGGDTPESVNEALDVSVNKIKWSTDNSTLRIIFLVGDAPPHMDYKDDVKYPDTCKKACEKGIIINTIQCGNNVECTKYWKEICLKAEGTFSQIAQQGGVVAIETPFDKRLAEINTEICGSQLAYGNREKQQAGHNRMAESAKLAAPAAADRAGFKAKDGKGEGYDLLDNVRKGNVKLEDVKKEELPKEMQGMSLKEQKEHLDKIEKRRADLNKEVIELDKKRSEFISKKMEETKGKDGFDQQVLDTLRKQAKKHKIDY